MSQSTSSPEVSVIIPVYNGASHLSKCLDSVLAQSHESFETIIVNDGSRDNTAEVCEAYAAADHRIIVLHTENNGPAAARNRGIEKALGEFIFFLDADDFLEKEALEWLTNAQRQFQADVVIGDFNQVKNDKIEYGCNGQMPESILLNRPEIVEQVRNYLKKPNRHLLLAYSWGRLFRSSIVKEHGIIFYPELKTFEDVSFNLEYLKHAETMYFIKKAVYNHLANAGFSSATMIAGDSPQRMFGYIRALAKASEFMHSCNVDMSKEIGHACISLTIIQFVRVCGQIDNRNRKTIHELIRHVINIPEVRNSLSCYFPGKGESRALPWLIKHKLIMLIVWLCQYKAHKRYGNAGEK